MTKGDKNNYKSFQELLKEEKYLMWRFAPSKESDQYWEKLINQYPDLEREISLADKYLKEKAFPKKYLLNYKKEDILNEIIHTLVHIEESRVNKKNKISKIRTIVQFGIAASILFLSCLLTYKMFFEKDFEHISICQLETENIQLISNGKISEFDKNINIIIDDNGIARIREEKTDKIEKTDESYKTNESNLTNHSCMTDQNYVTDNSKVTDKSLANNQGYTTNKAYLNNEANVTNKSNVTDQNTVTDEIEIKMNHSDLNSITVPYGKRATITLSDGSKVWLNSGTKLVFPSTFNKNRREVTLLGEMYIEVASNEAWPFIVETPEFNVRVLGTKFCISAYEKLQKSVVLVEGKVNLISNETKADLPLSPNELATLDSNNHTFSKRVTDVSQHITWTKGYLTLNETPIAEVLKYISRYYNLSLDCSNATNLKTITCNGKLYLSQDLENVMKSIATLSKTNYKKVNNTIYISDNND